MSSQPNLPVPPPSGPRLADVEAPLDASPAVAQAVDATEQVVEPVFAATRAAIYEHLGRR